MAVSKRLRFEIFRRDSHTCRYCGASAPDVPLRVDHVTPVALGGADTPDNLATSCEPCNNGKSSASPDTTHVANVSDDALRWADAMKQAAAELSAQDAPKRAYRDVFHAAWNEWTWERGGKKETFDLPGGWKTSLDNIREAGLPVEVWTGIVEKAMTTKGVSVENLFRYACGIAWRMVRDLQDRAKAITGSGSTASGPADSLSQAAIEIWESEQAEEVTPELRADFLFSLAEVRGKEEAHRVILAAQQAAWCGQSDLGGTLNHCDHSEAYHQWWCSWLTAADDYPSDAASAHVRKQIDTLLAASVVPVRITRAATYAGSRQSVTLHFGLDAEEHALLGITAFFWKANEIWREALQLSAGRKPNKAERSAFIESVGRIAADRDIYAADIYAAAAAAGAYQDPDISTCLPRRLSVFEIASRPLVPAA